MVPSEPLATDQVTDLSTFPVAVTVAIMSTDWFTATVASATSTWVTVPDGGATVTGATCFAVE